MPTDHRTELAGIRRFDQLVRYLRDRMDWPIDSDDFEELTFEYTPEELGIDTKNAARIQEIKRLRPLSPNQPWGIFFVKFEPSKLPVIALRRILGRVALKKRSSANSAERQAWAADDLLFVSNYGEGDQRQISFAHFSTPKDGRDLPTLKVLGWDNLDTALHLDAVAKDLTEHLRWPDDEADAEMWRSQWRAAFILRHREVIRTSQDLSIRLAELARAIRDRIRTALTIETETGPLTKLMKAFQEALVHDLDTDGFADMYAQTIAYGLLSARIADPHRRTADDFAAHMRTNPFLKELMETFLHVGGRRGSAGGPGIDFDELGVNEVADLLDDANMEAVIRDFGDRNPQEDPVIHFYELFLKEYDAKKRMQRGVFYTPRPVVSYIVRSVDELLRTEFGLADGLADTTTWGEMAKRHNDLKIPQGVPEEQAFVQVLDPATGTGTFLVEVIDLIHKTLVSKWRALHHGDAEIKALWNEYVPNRLLSRLHGYELLMAPYAIAHLKIGLKLYETGYRFESDERLPVYLTNTLEEAHEMSGMPLFTQFLAAEAAAAGEVKTNAPITVVIGNPPYSGHSANKGAWIGALMEDYKKSPELKKPAQAKWLSDDYVKFVRFAQWRIEQTGHGVLAFITNHMFLINPTFLDMRASLMGAFDEIYVLDLHGSSKPMETTPNGIGDKNVFDIQKGVAISLLVKRANRTGGCKVWRSDLWGTRPAKYEWLAANDATTTVWEDVAPLQAPWFFVKLDAALSAEYHQGWSVADIFRPNGDPAPGVVTTHDEFAISCTREEAIEKVEKLLASANEREANELFRLCSQSQWSYERAKRELADGKWKRQLTPILYRPFDTRWTVWNSNVVIAHALWRLTARLRVTVA